MASSFTCAVRRRSLCLALGWAAISGCAGADDQGSADDSTTTAGTESGSAASGGASASTTASASTSSDATSATAGSTSTDSGVSGTSSASTSGAGSDSTSGTGTATTDTGTTAGDEDLVMEAEDFTCITAMTPVRSYFVANPLGRLDETLAVANNPEGGRFPVGTVLQLVPTEAMVKRRTGFDPATNDWEFFSLGVNADGTRILDRGAATVVNAFGGNCLDCHSKAEPQWDLICETTHGCDPLPLTTAQIRQIQAADPRCP